jgi:hypothetical protein
MEDKPTIIINTRLVFNGIFALAVIIPLLYWGFIFFQVMLVNRSLIQKDGLITIFDHKSEGRHSSKLLFKQAAYPVTFSRTYRGPYENDAYDRIAQICGNKDYYRSEDFKGHPVTFYILSGDQSRLNNADQQIPLFYLKSKYQSKSTYDYYKDLFSYVFFEKFAFLYYLTALLWLAGIFIIVRYFIKTGSLPESIDGVIYLKIWVIAMMIPLTYLTIFI